MSGLFRLSLRNCLKIIFVFCYKKMKLVDGYAEHSALKHTSKNQAGHIKILTKN